MASFKIAFDKVILAEGGYVNDIDDAGGETYLGISRKNHPNANMWKYIDEYKKQYTIKELNNVLAKDEKIISEIQHIYSYKYWDVFDLDNVPNQKIAHQIFDDAVNRGVVAATRLAQHIMGMTVTGKITEELIYNLKQYE